MIRNLRLAACASVLLVATACSSVPEQQVALYVQAFEQAEEAGNLVYDEISPIVDERLDRAAAQAADGAALSDIAPAAGPEPTGPGATADGLSPALDGAFPTAAEIAAAACPDSLGSQPFEPCFFPERYLSEGRVDEPSAVAARRHALATIATFNSLLARLSGGEQAASLGPEVERLTASIGGLASFAAAGAGPLGAAVGTVAGRLATWARGLEADRQLRQALLDGAPMVDDLIGALIDETPLLFALKRDDLLDALRDARADANRARILARNLVQQHAAPTSGDLEQKSLRLNNALEPFGIAFVPLTRLAGARGSAPFDAAVASEFEEILARAEAATLGYRDGLEDLEAYRLALAGYVRMLASSRRLFADLVEAASSTSTVELDLTTVASEAVRIRSDAEDIRARLREL